MMINVSSNAIGSRLLLFLVLLSFSHIASAGGGSVEAPEQPPESMIKTTVSMRDHAYTLGDLISMQAEFTLEKGQIFDPNSVPLAGPVNAWLDLRDVFLYQDNNDDGSTHLTIDFTWQIFGTVAEAQIIKIPAIILQTLPPETGQNEDDKAQSSIITIAEQPIYLSPVLPEKLGEEEAPRPIMPPPRFDTAMPLMMAVLYLGLALLLVGFWLWLQDKISWLPRHPGAMTLLARQLRHQKVAQQTTLSQADLRMIHAGLAGSAGQSLYPNTLNVLFEKAPHLSAEQEIISQFFNDSWSLFHGKNTGENMISVSETVAWIRRAAIAERLSRNVARKNLN